MSYFLIFDVFFILNILEYSLLEIASTIPDNINRRRKSIKNVNRPISGILGFSWTKNLKNIGK
jgi:hypothetical protein